MNDSQIQKNISSASDRFLEFYLGGQSYSVELLKVKEVITPPEMRPIPQSAPHVLGVMNLRGEVLTVVDLRIQLNIKASKDQSQAAVIIFDLEDRLVGAVVDSINKVLNVHKENIKALPVTESSSSSHFLGGIQEEGRLSILMDPGIIKDKTKLKVA